MFKNGLQMKLKCEYWVKLSDHFADHGKMVESGKCVKWLVIKQMRLLRK